MTFEQLPGLPARRLGRRHFLTILGAGALGAGAVSAGLATRASASTPATLAVDIVNNTGADTVYAYVTGNAIDNGNVLTLLRSDGHTPYYPASPSAVGSPLGADCAIPLGASGSRTRVTIPHLAGGRIWFSIGSPLTFLLNPGPGLVEPSVTNPSDPNYHLVWDFCEFTYNAANLYANISFVDFLCIPVGLQLTNTSGGTQSAPGLKAGGLDTVCSGLAAQAASDGYGWNQLVVTSGGQNLRALSPTNGIVLNPSLLSGYFDGYLNQVWSKYSSQPLYVDTQVRWGTVTGHVSGGVLNFPGVGSFAKPSSADIFSCNSGPFGAPGAEMGALTARISAAMNRSTLLIDANQPDDENPATYYTNPVTNHYARLAHATSIDGRGYAFPYDDVAPNGGVDQSGAVVDPNPTLWTVTLGPVHNGSGGPPPPPPGSSAYSPIQATADSAGSGLTVEACSDSGGGQDLGQLANGAWAEYPNIDFGSTPATQFYARVASGANGVSGLVDVVLDNPSNAPIGSFAIGNTGGWQSWRTVPANVSSVTGVHTVYLKFNSGQPAPYVSVHWFDFGH